MKFLKLVKNFLSGRLLKVFPAFGYKGMVDLQVKKYLLIKKEHPEAAENKILAALLESRRGWLIKDPGANEYYLDLIRFPEKTALEIISLMVEWEYLDNMDSCARITKNNIPPDFVEKHRQEIRDYVRVCLEK